MKSAIPAANDRYEVEAETLADRVLRTPEPARSNTDSQPTRALEPLVSSSPPAPLTPALDLTSRSRSSGVALPHGTRRYLEPRLGYDLAGVRVHTDPYANAAAESLGARAFTLGRDIYFRRDSYSPHDARGTRLLTHELVHVAQQCRTNAPGGRSSLGALPLRVTPAPAAVQRYGIAETIREATAQVFAVGAEAALQARRDAETAENATAASGLPGLHNGPADAWRHCYWTCLMTRSIGVHDAARVARTHERLNPNELNEQEMDAHNNAAGVDCGKGRNDCRGCCHSGLMTGRLLIIPDWNVRARERPVPARGIAVVTAPHVAPEAGPSYYYGGARYTEDTRQRLYWIHTALDLAGLVPALGAIPDAINATLFLVEGDWAAAGVSAVAMVPVLGEGAAATRLGLNITRRGVDRLGREGLEYAFVRGSRRAARAATETAGRVSVNRLARRVLLKHLNDIPLLDQIWREVANPVQLTKANLRGVFTNHRRRFWAAVRRNATARRLFEDAGFEFRGGPRTAPVFRGMAGREGTLSLDHRIRLEDLKESGPFEAAIDSGNLRLVVHGDNTLLENLQRVMPDWPADRLAALRELEELE